MDALGIGNQLATAEWIQLGQATAGINVPARLLLRKIAGKDMRCLVLKPEIAAQLRLG
jgi:hypothetical protein